jgi:hypothetical protein
MKIFRVQIQENKKKNESENIALIYIDSSGRAEQRENLRLIIRRDWWFESRRGHGCLFLLGVACVVT